MKLGKNEERADERLISPMNSDYNDLTEERPDGSKTGVVEAGVPVRKAVRNALS